MIGTTVDKYKILSQIGEGGMGIVYLGEHLTLARKVAIKMLHSQYSRNKQFKARFKNEAATLAKLSHPNIVGLYSFLEQDEKTFLVMEYVEGENLDDVIHRLNGPLPNEQLNQLLTQVLAALSYAHDQGVIHRDIKPSNFILTPENQIKILDFGVAKILGETQAGITKTGARLGTVYYMSPEQVQLGKADHRSDIYGLGVMLYVMATGVNPYENLSSEFEIFNQIVQEDLPNPKIVYPGVSDRISALIQIATIKDPSFRFQSCAEFGKAMGSNPASLLSRAAHRPIGNRLKNGGSQAQSSPNHLGRQAETNEGPNLMPPLSTWKKIYTGIMLTWSAFAIGAMFLYDAEGLATKPFLVLILPLAIAGIGMIFRRDWGRILTRAYLFFLGLISLMFLFATVREIINDWNPGNIQLEHFYPPLLFFSHIMVAIWGILLFKGRKKIVLYL